jgi:putative Mn2+ efflux pump MntP
MNLLTILLISVGLSLDIFACTVAICMAMKGISWVQALRMSLTFSLFHVAMAAFGFVLGTEVLRHIARYDHWLAFGLLLLVGVHMIYNSLTEGEEHYERVDHTRGKELVVLSIATSIDALVLGIGLAALHTEVVMTLTCIGVVVFLFGILATQVGARVGTRTGRYAETVGGLILIVLGLKIVLEHLCA